jgi:hypothetical protein
MRGTLLTVEIMLSTALPMTWAPAKNLQQLEDWSECAEEEICPFGSKSREIPD